MPVVQMISVTIAPNVHLVDCDKISEDRDGKRQCYHISINYGDLPIGMLYMILPKHKYLTNEHAQLLSNTADDIAIGLSAANQRQEQHAIEVAKQPVTNAWKSPVTCMIH